MRAMGCVSYFDVTVITTNPSKLHIVPAALSRHYLDKMARLSTTPPRGLGVLPDDAGEHWERRYLDRDRYLSHIQLRAPDTPVPFHQSRLCTYRTACSDHPSIPRQAIRPTTNPTYRLFKQPLLRTMAIGRTQKTNYLPLHSTKHRYHTKDCRFYIELSST